MGKLSHYIKVFEHIITKILILLLGIVVVMSVVDLSWRLLQDLLQPPFLLLDEEELTEFFGMVLFVLIGIELVETLKAYIVQNEIRAEIILLVTIIALARKIMTLNFKETPSLSLIGIAVIVGALAVAYYIIKRTRVPPLSPEKS